MREIGSEIQTRWRELGTVNCTGFLLFLFFSCGVLLASFIGFPRVRRMLCTVSFLFGDVEVNPVKKFP